ncbi:MAG: hypothetical protein AAF790_13380 [Planctomycetota bacterium]
MGAQRQDQDHHDRRQIVPKLTLAGRIDATFAPGPGAPRRPVVIEGAGQTVTVIAEDVRTVWALRKAAFPGVGRVLGVAGKVGWKVMLRTAGGVEVELAPSPSLAVRTLAPALRPTE